MGRFCTWVEGLETAWRIKDDAEVASKWWGQCCGTCFWVDLSVYEHNTTEKLASNTPDS